jgi:hypothetical protein
VRSSPSPSEDRDSPSSTSLELTTTPLSAELGNKSSSAPLLVKKAVSPGTGGGKPEDVKRRVSDSVYDQLAFCHTTILLFRTVFWDDGGSTYPLKRRSIIILHGSTSQKTILNFIFASVRT